MVVRSLLAFVLSVTAVAAVVPSTALAQGGEVSDGGAAPPSPKPAPVAPPTGLLAPPPAASAEAAPRAPRGPAVRERGRRRSRGSSIASGALMLFMLVGAMGYYIIKRLRR